ncbi:LysR substrate-binding domain-containing protein, partial [Phenylobacterium sp. CCH12-B4]
SGVASGEGGVVRLAASDIIGIEVLPDILSRFRRANPGVDVELTLSNKNEDLNRRDADVAVRMSRPTQNSLVAKKVGELSVGFYATPDYVERHGLPTDFDELAGHTLIGFDRQFPDMVNDLSIGRPITRDLFALRTDNDVAQLAALRAGFGIGACQRQIGERFGLVPVMPDAFSFKLDIWICMHETLRGSPRMRLMFDHLAQELGAYAAKA